MNVTPQILAGCSALEASDHLRFSPMLGLYPLQHYKHDFSESIVNAFDVEAWKKATNLCWLGLRLVVRHGTVRVRVSQAAAGTGPVDLLQLEQSGPGTQTSPRLRLSALQGVILPLIEYQTADAVFELIFETDDHPINQNTHVNYIICTFRRAEYVQHNARVFSDYVEWLGERDRAHLTIVDNGSQNGATDCGVSTQGRITVFANQNTGGAGGFGRGMYETCYGALSGHGFSHVCLLDDDIYLDREMFARTTAFLRFMRDDHHLGAPMYPVSSERMIPKTSVCFGHTFRGTVHPSDTALGRDLQTDDIEPFLTMDREPDSTGWWWNAFHVQHILALGLPYPFFVKMDDVEYALRLQSAGIDLVVPASFWVLHEDFDEKYSAVMQYFRFRNRCVLLAQNGILPPARTFAKEYCNLIAGFITEKKYEHAQLMIDAMHDFLGGPYHLLRREQEILTRTIATVQREKNGAMRHPPEGAAIVNPSEKQPDSSSPLAGEGGRLRSPFRRGDSLTIDVTRGYDIAKCRRAKSLTYWNPHKKVGFTVKHDGARALRQRLEVRYLRGEIARHLPSLARAYALAKLHLVSPEFWSGYGMFGRKRADAPPKAGRLGSVSPDNTLQQDAVTGAPDLADPIMPADHAFFNSIRNRHLGQRCFVLGNGPSLRVADLERMAHEVTFASNKIYLCFGETTWRPTFYSVEDLLVAENCRSEIAAIDRVTKIFPHHMLKFLPRQPNHHYARWLPPKDNRSSYREFSCDLTKGICWGSTVTYSMLQMAVHMGFKDIYLLGVDHSYVEPPEKDGNALISSGEINHFHPDYRQAGERWHLPVLDRLETSYQFAQDFCQSIGVNIYNASRETKLDAFPRVDFDDLSER
jgi:GT2 family glycosyltransferase